MHASGQSLAALSAGRRALLRGSARVSRRARRRRHVQLLSPNSIANGRRSPILDFVSFTTSALVHAGDDRSVDGEPREPAAYRRSVRDIVGERPYAVGPSAIGMRDNPYGAGDDAQSRQYPAGDEPQRSAPARPAGRRLECRLLRALRLWRGRAIALGGAVGPFGLLHAPADSRSPGSTAWRFVSRLSRRARPRVRSRGAPMRAVEISAPREIQAFAAGNELWLANLMGEPRRVKLTAAMAGRIARLDAESFSPRSQDPDALDRLQAAVRGRRDRTRRATPACDCAPLEFNRRRSQLMPKFAANLSMMFTEHAFLDRFDAAAEAGFAAVEFLFPYDHPPEAIAERLARNRLTQALFNLPPGRLGGGRARARRAARPFRRIQVRASTRALDYVAATGVRRVHMMAGNASRTTRRPRRATAARFGTRRRSSPSAASTSCSSRSTRATCPAISSTISATRVVLIASLGLPNVKLAVRRLPSSDHAWRRDDGVPRRCSRIVGHIQVASVPSRHEPDGEELNYPYLFAEFDRLGYDGFIGCEYNPRGRNGRGARLVSALPEGLTCRCCSARSPTTTPAPRTSPTR